jgi:hypothetical protein
MAGKTAIREKVSIIPEKLSRSQFRKLSKREKSRYLKDLKKTKVVVKEIDL